MAVNGVASALCRRAQGSNIAKALDQRDATAEAQC